MDEPKINAKISSLKKPRIFLKILEVNKYVKLKIESVRLDLGLATIYTI